MARKRKRAAAPEPGSPPDTPPPRITTGLGDLLKRELSRPKPQPASKPQGEERAPASPTPPLGPEERPGRQSRRPPTQAPPGPEPPQPVQPVHDARSLRMLNDAYAGAVPLTSSRQRRKGRVAGPRGPAVVDYQAAARQGDEEARARLGALVGGGVRFSIERDEDGRYAGLRDGVGSSALRALRSPNFQPEATLDLHGMRADAAEREIVRFVRERRRRGARQVMIIHGAGTHSEDGISVLGPRTVKALTDGGAAPLVQAFATAHTRRGGLGALAVLLK